MTTLTAHDIRNAILYELKEGHLAKIAPPGELALCAPLVELHLADRIPPLSPWKMKAGWTPITPADLAKEIKAEFTRLFDQLHENPLEAKG